MCGMAGWVSFNRDLRSDQMTVDSMTETMSCRRAKVQIRSRLSTTERDRQLLTLEPDTVIAHFLSGPSSGRRLLAGLALAGTMVIGACSAPSPPSSARGLSQQPSTSVRPGSPSDPLSGLASLALQRIMTGDQVAAAKFGTHQPIDDPPREQQVLDSVAAASPGMSLSPQESVQFFRDQIEANKVVQRGLYQRWTAYPKQRPTDRPDLNKQLRPDLDRLTTDILRQLQATTTVRHAGMQCIAQAGQALAEAAKPLDQLHRDALTVALRSVCSQS